ncbi:MAG: hypothetical protein Q7S46_14620, partial [Gallionella sp.]|nr:hypothetical protein [Gallionella sp.]
MPKSEAHKWVFAPRFRRNAFGWRSQPAVQRVKEAIAEIQKVARKNPVLAAGHGYEITGIEVLAAYSATMEGARNAATVDQTRSRIR